MHHLGFELAPRLADAVRHAKIDARVADRHARQTGGCFGGGETFKTSLNQQVDTLRGLVQQFHADAVDVQKQLFAVIDIQRHQIKTAATPGIG